MHLSVGDVICLFFFVKQKTAYEMRISDWSSDVCSSDLLFFSTGFCRHEFRCEAQRQGLAADPGLLVCMACLHDGSRCRGPAGPDQRRRDRKSVVSGKRGAVRVVIGGRRIIKKKTHKKKDEKAIIHIVKTKAIISK